MNLAGTQIKDTYGNLITIGSVAGTPTTGTLQNGAGSDLTTITVAGTLNATTLGGTLSTAAQTNVTSLGTLTGLSVSGTTGLDGAVTINESGADVDFRVEGDTEPNLFFVDASTDRVGIGTNTPSVKMDVVGNDMASFDGDLPNTNTALTISSKNVTTVADGYATLLQIRGITGRGGVVGIGAVSTSSSKDVNYALAFYRNSASEKLAEAMRIDASGNVGIGTTSPAKKLDVSGEIRASTGILFGSDTAAANTLDDYEEGTVSYTHLRAHET